MDVQIEEMNKVMEVAKKIIDKDVTMSFVSLGENQLAFILAGVKNGKPFSVKRGCFDCTSGAYDAVNLSLRLKKEYVFLKTCSTESAAETKARLDASQNVPVDELFVALGDDNIDQLKRELGREVESCSFFESIGKDGETKHYYVASIANIDYIFKEYKK